MGFPALAAGRLRRYASCALLLGLVLTVCAEAVVAKDVGLLTPGEIEENLQVS
jgi:hypothetical protein